MAVATEPSDIQYATYDIRIMYPEKLSIPDHLDELRTRLIIALTSVVVFTVAAFIYSDSLLEFIIEPIKKSISTLYFMTPYEAFMTRVKISLASGIVLSLPVIFWQLYLFVTPGLHNSEKKAIGPVVVASVGLFAIGVLFAYFLVIPFALQFFLGFSTKSLQPIISIQAYISFWLSIVLVFGFSFDVPILVLALIYLGVLKTEVLRKKRRVVIVVAFIIAAVITPTVDIITQCLLAVALWILFELSLFVGKRIEKNKDAT